MLDACYISYIEYTKLKLKRVLSHRYKFKYHNLISSRDGETEEGKNIRKSKVSATRSTLQMTYEPDKDDG